MDERVSWWRGGQTCYQVPLSTIDKLVLYCIVLYCIVLYCIVLYCTVLYCTVLYCTVLYSTLLYSTELCCTVLYCTVLHCTVLYSTVVFCFSQDSTEEMSKSIRYILVTGILCFRGFGILLGPFQTILDVSGWILGS